VSKPPPTRRPLISPANWARTHLPTREALERNRWVRPFAHIVLRPDLWRFNRRSVPRGIALGLFAGILIPFAHSLIAATTAVLFRANVPVAVAATWSSNPATWMLIFPGAIAISRGLGMNADMHQFMALLHHDAGLAAWGHWLLSSAAPALMLGLLVEATVVAALGYAATVLFWRLHIARQRNNSVRRRAARAA
jgi:uncharacterized protein (DUF2062 family)